MRVAGVAFALFQILSVTSLFGSCSFPITDRPHATAVVYNPNTASFSSFPASIFLDGKFVCRISLGSYVVIPLTAGPHSLRGQEKTGTANFDAGVTYYYKASTYIKHNVLVYTSLAPAPKEDLEYELSGLTPAKGETKPLPESFQLRNNVLTPSKSRVDVAVIQRLPVNSAYNWYTASADKMLCDGAPCVACSSQQQRCVTYRTMPEAGTQVLEGALLRLLYPTGDVVLVRCVDKPDIGAELGMLASGTPSTNTKRSCRIPDPNTTVQAETEKIGIKLYMTSLGGNTNETYEVVGILRPSLTNSQ